MENVAIANALQLEAARRHASFFALITTPCKVWSRWTCPLPYYSAFLLLIHYFMRWLWLLTFDFEHLQCNACDDLKLFTKYERNRVFALSIFDLMTLNIVLHVALVGCGIIFTKFDLQQLIRDWIIAFFMLMMSSCDHDLWSVDLKISWYIKRHVIKVCTKSE